MSQNFRNYKLHQWTSLVGKILIVEESMGRQHIFHSTRKLQVYTPTKTVQSALQTRNWLYIYIAALFLFTFTT